MLHFSVLAIEVIRLLMVVVAVDIPGLVMAVDVGIIIELMREFLISAGHAIVAAAVEGENTRPIGALCASRFLFRVRL